MACLSSESTTTDRPELRQDFLHGLEVDPAARDFRQLRVLAREERIEAGGVALGFVDALRGVAFGLAQSLGRAPGLGDGLVELALGHVDRALTLLLGLFTSLNEAWTGAGGLTSFSCTWSIVRPSSVLVQILEGLERFEELDVLPADRDDFVHRAVAHLAHDGLRRVNVPQGLYSGSRTRKR